MQDELLKDVENKFWRYENVEYLFEFFESKIQMKLKIEHILHINSPGKQKFYINKRLTGQPDS